MQHRSSLTLLLALFTIAIAGAATSSQASARVNRIKEHDLQFEHLSLADGLSQSTVLCVFQDSRGFLWFGTRHGMNKYDGYRFTTFAYAPDDSASLSNNWVEVILEDSHYALWVGCMLSGIEKTSLSKNYFNKHSRAMGNESVLKSRLIYSFFEDDNGLIWIGTGRGLALFDRKQEILLEVKNYDPGLAKITSNIFSIQQDRYKNIWIGTNGQGLFRYTARSKHSGAGGLKQYLHQSQNPESLGSNSIWAIKEDRDGSLWGLVRLAPGLTVSTRKTIPLFAIRVSSTGCERFSKIVWGVCGWAPSREV